MADNEFDIESVAESIRSASLGSLLQAVTMDGFRECHDFEGYLRRLRTRVVRELYGKLKEYQAIKVMIEIDAEYVKPEIVNQAGGALERARKEKKRREYEQYEDDKDVASIGLVTKLRPITHATQVQQLTDQMFEELRQRHITKMQNGSGFMIRAIVKTVLKVAEHVPLAGRSYLPLPPFLMRKKHGCIVNVQNMDYRCFGYALLAAVKNLDWQQRPQDPRCYTEQDFELYGLHDLDYPVRIENLEDIERQLDIPINVYTFFDDEGKGRKPIYISKLDDPQKATDLLFWEKEGVGHFAWIRNFSGFLHDLNANSGRRVHWCKRCFSHFYSVVKFEQHLERCMGVEGYKCIHQLPAEGTKLEFKNQKYHEHVPFVIYVDFESVTKKIDQNVQPAQIAIADMEGVSQSQQPQHVEHAEQAQQTRETQQAEQRRVPTKNVYQEHVPVSVGLKLVSAVPGVLDDIPYETYTGEDVTKWLLQKLLDYQAKCMEFLNADKPVALNVGQQVSYDMATHCYICAKPFSNERRGLIKVCDHDHVSGEYRGPAHSSCNLLLRKQRKIPVFWHNFRGYDSHLIVPALGLFKEKLSVIAQTMEKYLVMNFGDHLSLKDTFQFMSCSLDRLTQDLLSSGKAAFRRMRAEFAQHGEETFDLLLRKGVYPYDYMDSIARLDETVLPPREAFFNRLRQQECSEADYDHAHKVWRTFGCNTMADYHNLYLKCDVLQLADVFESFRDMALHEYELDPAHYVSAPHLTWDAMLRSTGCSLELLSDDAMYTMIHKNLRGGVAMISKRRGVANNKYMKEHYDPSKASKYLLYVDANNLYGWSMSQNLPDGDFKWVDEDEWSQVDWTQQYADQQRGYIVECDLDYPDELHDLHSDYPLAPERMTVATDLLSERQQNIHAKYDVASSVTQPKLIPNLFPKRKYACHYMNLKFYMEHGMKLVKVHRVISFHQSKWLATYIDKNSKLRAAALNSFQKGFFKLMNNAVYGKTTENVLNRRDIHLENDRDHAKKLIDKPHCTGFRIFTPDVSAVCLQKITAKIDKPTYVGYAVLEYAKLLMYDFHYNHVLKQWPDGKVRLCMTDTDSLLYEIETEDVYEDICNNQTLRDWFDTSNYPADHPLFSVDNKMVIGKMKDEAAGQIMVDIVGLRAKMYSIKVFNPATGEFTETQKAKGIQKASMAAIDHQDYINQLTDPHENRVTVRRIGHMFHVVLTFEQSKRALCAFDDKRYLLEDLVDTYAHGHYRIRALEPVQQDVTGGVQPNTVFEDEEGERHLVVTHAAVVNTPALAMMFEAEDGELSATASIGDDDDVRSAATEISSGGASDAELALQEKVQNARMNFQWLFTPADFEAAEALVDVAAANLVNNATLSTQQLRNLLLGKVGEAQPPCRRRALELLDAASGSDKNAALTNYEKFLFVTCKVGNDVGPTHVNRYGKPGLKHPHKQLFMLLSGRSAWWYDKHNRTLLDKLSDEPAQLDEASSTQTSMESATKRMRMNDGSASAHVVSNSESDANQAVRANAEKAKKQFERLFTKDDFAAAETLIDNAMVNLGSILYVGNDARALQELRARLTGKDGEAQSSRKSRALELLDAAHGSSKWIGLSEYEQLLFVACKATKAMGTIRSTHPHKLLFMLLSGRSAGWYDKNHKKLLDSMSMRK